MKKNVRKQGILLPISSIPSTYGIGTFGKESYRFVDFLEKSGNHLWQILPLGPTGYGDSPYQSFSTTIQRETKLFLGADNEETAELTVPMYDFGDWASRMKAYRKKNHITQQELAQLMGVKHFTLRSWEQKQAKPPYNVWRLHKHLFDDSIKLT